jgi:hypothetical protein
MRRNVVIVVLLSLASLLLWNTLVLYPLKLLVVLMHETGHALAALVTGGSVFRVEVNALQGGMTYTAGGNRLIILSAGYLGSSLIGALVLWAASHRTMSKYVAEIFGMLIVVETAFWVRDLFTCIFASAMGIFCMILGWKLRGVFERLFMQLVGAVSCLYAVFDIFDDVVRRIFIGGTVTFGKSDAQALAEITFIPSLVWGVVWIAIAVWIFVTTLRNLPETKASPDGNDVPAIAGSGTTA